MRFRVTNKHIGKIVEHRPSYGKPERGRLIGFEKRGRFHLARVEFSHPHWIVERADLYPVSEDEE